MAAEEIERITRVSRFWSVVWWTGDILYYLPIGLLAFGAPTGLTHILRGSRTMGEIIIQAGMLLLFCVAWAPAGLALKDLSRWQTRVRTTNHK